MLPGRSWRPHSKERDIIVRFWLDKKKRLARKQKCQKVFSQGRCSVPVLLQGVREDDTLLQHFAQRECWTETSFLTVLCGFGQRKTCFERLQQKRGNGPGLSGKKREAFTHTLAKFTLFSSLFRLFPLLLCFHALVLTSPFFNNNMNSKSVQCSPPKPTMGLPNHFVFLLF